MKRWDKTSGQHVSRPDIDRFIDEVAEVCKRHNMAISHEDSHGAFIIERCNSHLLGWLDEAFVGQSMNQANEPTGSMSQSEETVKEVLKMIQDIESLCESLRANLCWRDPANILRRGCVEIAKRAVSMASKL